MYIFVTSLNLNLETLWYIQIQIGDYKGIINVKLICFDCQSVCQEVIDQASMNPIWKLKENEIALQYLCFLHKGISD